MPDSVIILKEELGENLSFPFISISILWRLGCELLVGMYKLQHEHAQRLDCCWRHSWRADEKENWQPTSKTFLEEERQIWSVAKWLVIQLIYATSMKSKSEIK